MSSAAAIAASTKTLLDVPCNQQLPRKHKCMLQAKKCMLQDLPAVAAMSMKQNRYVHVYCRSSMRNGTQDHAGKTRVKQLCQSLTGARAAKAFVWQQCLQHPAGCLVGERRYNNPMVQCSQQAMPTAAVQPVKMA